MKGWRFYALVIAVVAAIYAAYAVYKISTDNDYRAKLGFGKLPANGTGTA